MKNTLTRAHLDDVLDTTLQTLNASSDRHLETGRAVTATIKVKLEFNKESMRAEFTGASAVDIPDGEFDSEIKRTDKRFLCTLINGEKGQQRIPGTDPVEDLQKTVEKLGVDMTIMAGGKSVTIHGRKGKKVGKEAAAGND